MIKPINIITKNVAKELKSVASKNATSTSQLYIEINSVKTLLQKGDAEFVEIYAKDMSTYTNETALRDASIKFDQEYDVTVLSTYKGYPFGNMICEVEFEEHESLAYLIIKKGSKLEYYDALYSEFLDYINEQKLRSGIFLHLFDAEYKNNIKVLVDVIEKIKKVTFNEDKKILLAQGVNAVESVNAEISMLIEDHDSVDSEANEGKVDYANRGFLLSCVEGEQLFEFIKPQQGQHGRSCKGELIEVESVNINASPTFTVENGIEVEDSFDNIKYFSNKSGYLIKEGNKYDVRNSIDIDEISFKTTGTINSDLNAEISINVIKNNPLEDAIEEGMHVKVQTLNVKGSIGPNTKVEARTISIDGQTHNDSFIRCINAEIGQHRGKIIGRKVEVKTLEGGEIIADVAIITNALRGVIKAKTIQINTLGSYVTMEAAESIEVERLQGEENKFIIDTSAKSPFDKSEDTDANTKYLQKLQEESRLLFAKLKESAAKLKKNLEPCKKIKALIIKNKNEGLEISSKLIKNFKLCNVMKVHYKKLQEDFEHKKAQAQALEKKLSAGALNPLDVKITIHNPHRSYNSIIYKLDNPQREIELKMDENMNKKVFKLQEDEDGVLKIINIAK